MVDADHGYGNALNVRRTIEELETAGVSAIAVEDTVLPRPYAGPETGLIPRDEFRQAASGRRGGISTTTTVWTSAAAKR